jgi:hypothetical protein
MESAILDTTLQFNIDADGKFSFLSTQKTLYMIIERTPSVINKYNGKITISTFIKINIFILLQKPFSCSFRLFLLLHLFKIFDFFAC